MRYVTKIISQLFIFSLVILIFSANLRAAGSGNVTQPPATFSNQALEKLVQPIALYPDLLLQQLLAAATFPEQLLDAAMYNEQGNPPENIPSQNWDQSVKAIANYPSILRHLANNLDWTINLGSAFINQNAELRDTIQKLRLRAKNAGNLKDTAQQSVIEEKTPQGENVIRIESSDPQVVYVPSNTTTVIYEEPVDTSDYWAPVVTFGLGMAMGYAMGDDDDDHYYGGYYGPGFWHNDDAIDDWVDYRQDRWDDVHDFRNDRQEFRQDSREDWREYRQGLDKKQQDWKAQAQNRAGQMTPEQRAQASSRANNARASWQGKSADQRAAALQDRSASSSSFSNSGRAQQARQNNSTGTFSKTSGSGFSSADREAANQRLNSVRSSDHSKQWQARQAATRSGSTSYGSGSGSYNRGSAYSGMSSRSYSASRASARGSYSMNRSAGGFSRGGGGFSRGGGGGFRGGGGRR